MNPPRTVPVNLYDRKAFPWLAGICLAVPGLVLLDEASGRRVRVRDDGSLEEIAAGGHPHGGAASDPANVGGRP